VDVTKEGDKGQIRPLLGTDYSAKEMGVHPESWLTAWTVHVKDAMRP